MKKTYYRSNHDCFGNPTYTPDGYPIEESHPVVGEDESPIKEKVSSAVQPPPQQSQQQQ